MKKTYASKSLPQTMIDTRDQIRANLSPEKANLVSTNLAEWLKGPVAEELIPLSGVVILSEDEVGEFMNIGCLEYEFSDMDCHLVFTLAFAEYSVAFVVYRLTLDAIVDLGISNFERTAFTSN